jgi:ribonuclease R
MIEGKLTIKRKKELEDFVILSAERSSTTERTAEEAERTVDDQKATEFMQNKIGEVFDGTISGVSPNGFFVELDNTVEGFVGLERLPQGRYEYNEDRYSISGVGQVYKIGDRIRVRVVSTDIALRHVNFELENFHREVIDRKEEMISAMDYRKEKRNSHQNHSKNHSKSNKNHRRR